MRSALWRCPRPLSSTFKSFSQIPLRKSVFSAGRPSYQPLLTAGNAAFKAGPRAQEEMPGTAMRAQITADERQVFDLEQCCLQRLWSQILLPIRDGATLSNGGDRGHGSVQIPKGLELLRGKRFSSPDTSALSLGPLWWLSHSSFLRGKYI